MYKAILKQSAYASGKDDVVWSSCLHKTEEGALEENGTARRAKTARRAARRAKLELWLIVVQVDEDSPLVLISEDKLMSAVKVRGRRRAPADEQGKQRGYRSTDEHDQKLRKLAEYNGHAWGGKPSPGKMVCQLIDEEWERHTRKQARKAKGA